MGGRSCSGSFIWLCVSDHVTQAYQDVLLALGLCLHCLPFKCRPARVPLTPLSASIKDVMNCLCFPVSSVLATEASFRASSDAGARGLGALLLLGWLCPACGQVSRHEGLRPPVSVLQAPGLQEAEGPALQGLVEGRGRLRCPRCMTEGRRSPDGRGTAFFVHSVLDAPGHDSRAPYLSHRLSLPCRPRCALP